MGAWLKPEVLGLWGWGRSMDRKSSVSSVIIGASSSAQIRENLTLNTSFTAEELARIDEISPAEEKAL